MGLPNFTIEKDATISKTGGTAVNFQAVGGSDIPGGIKVVDVGNTDYKTRATITAKYKEPTLSSGGVYSKSRNTMLLVQPKVLTDGSTVFNLVEIRVEVHPDTSSADAASLRNMGCQLLFDTDLSAFWATGSKS